MSKLKIPDLVVKKTPTNATVKARLPGDGSPEAIAQAIVQITLDRQNKLFEQELKEAKKFEEENGPPPESESGLKLPSASDLVRRSHKLRTEAIRVAVAPHVLGLDHNNMIMLYVYLCGMEQAVAPTGRIVQGIAQKLNPDAVSTALIAEMNDIAPADVMAAMFANKKVDPGQRVTLQMSQVPEEVREQIAGGFTEKAEDSEE